MYSLSFVPGGAGATTLNGHHAEIVHKVGGRHTKPVHGPALPTKIMEENVSIWGEGVITVTKDVQVERETDELWSDEESLGGILVTKNFRVEETNADDDDDDRSERRRSR